MLKVDMCEEYEVIEVEAAGEAGVGEVEGSDDAGGRTGDTKP